MSESSAIGIIFLYNKEHGSPEKVSKELSDYFSQITENLVSQGLMDLPRLKKIMEEKKIFWGAIKENFENILNDTDAIGHIAWNVFKKHTGIEASEDVKLLIYDGTQAPWNFTLMACVLYQ